MNSLLVLSDDLTGANDCGLQFAKRGIPTTVYIDDSHPTAHNADNSAHVINIESRSLSPEEAFGKWKLLKEAIDWQSYRMVMKKIDSTLRGNVGIEVQAMMEMGYFDVAIVAPAYPEKGRITIGGYHLIHQQLLQDSEISRDPKFPVTNSKVAEMIRQQTNLLIGEIDINTLRSSSYSSAVEQLMQSGTRIVIVDSVMKDDLNRIAVELTGKRVLWVGSSGLANALSIRYPQCPYDNNEVTNEKSAPILVVAGSVSGVTQQQVGHLIAHEFECIKLDPMLLIRGLDPTNRGENSMELEEISKRARDIIASGRHLVIATEASESKRKEVNSFLSSIGSIGLNGGNAIADQIGSIAAKLIASEQLSGCVLTGGDIAYQTCKHLGIRSLRIIGEVEEGLPLCTAGEAINIPLVTKAGAFGNKNSMLLAARAMMNVHHSVFR